MPAPQHPSTNRHSTARGTSNSPAYERRKPHTKVSKYQVFCTPTIQIYKRQAQKSTTDCQQGKPFTPCNDEQITSAGRPPTAPTLLSCAMLAMLAFREKSRLTGPDRCKARRKADADERRWLSFRARHEISARRSSVVLCSCRAA